MFPPPGVTLIVQGTIGIRRPLSDPAGIFTVVAVVVIFVGFAVVVVVVVVG